MTLKNLLFAFFVILIGIVVVNCLGLPLSPTQPNEFIVLNNNDSTSSEEYIIERVSSEYVFVFKEPNYPKPTAFTTQTPPSIKPTVVKTTPVNQPTPAITAVAMRPTPTKVAEKTPEKVPEAVQEKSISLEGFKEIYSGVFYKKSGNVANIRVDITNPNVRYFVNPAQSTMTVCGFVSKYKLQLAINGGGFDIGGTGQAIPFSMSDGLIYSVEKTPGITIFISNSNKIAFSQDGNTPSGTKYAITGFNLIVDEGKMIDKMIPGKEGYKDGYGIPKRRTTIGISGNWLNIALFDSPISVTASGQYHLDTFPGTKDVYNMDGGGSTNACTDSFGSLVTESGRPVANIFGIYSSPIK